MPCGVSSGAGQQPDSIPATRFRLQGHRTCAGSGTEFSAQSQTFTINSDFGILLAFDAVNAWRVFELQRYAREEPQTPVREVLSETEMEVIEDFVQFRRLLPPAQRERPPPEDIRGWVVRLARIAGFRPWKRQPLPGNQVLWKAWKIVQICVLREQARAARG